MEAGWRQRAVERSLGAARQRAVSRSERFITVATEMLRRTGSLDFTVSELVERSGLSLRAFYSHFEGKDELLLAVLEEAVGGFVATLRAELDALDDPEQQLRVYVTRFHSAGHSSDRRASAALSRYLLALTSQSSGQVARVLAPQVQLLSEVVTRGVVSGIFRADIAPEALTVLVTQTLLSAVEMDVLGTEITGQPVTADDLWEFCRGALSPRR